MMPYQHQSCAAGSVPVHTPFTTAKQSKKSLRFQTSVTVQPIDCRMNQEEKSRSYYTKAELKAFSLEVKAVHTLSKELPDEFAACTAHTSEKDCLVGQYADPSLRGMELYLCPMRVRNKALVLKAVLKYHRSLKANPNKTDEEQLRYLARASSKLSQWSSHIAIETARLDSLRACGEDYWIPVNEPMDISPFPATKRRRDTPCGEKGRSTKRRIW